jgi:dTDP-glucose 4,6-dehydratase
LVKKILALMGEGEDKIEFVADRLGHDYRYAINATKAWTELGWKKEIDFSSGLKETIEWYKNNSSWWEELKNR